MDELANWGRLHPLLVHLPIGFVLGLALLEAAALATRSELPRRAVGPLVLATAVASALAVGAGWALQSGGEYSGELFERHRLGGFVVAGLTALAWICHRSSRRGENAVWLFFYRVLLLTAAVAIGPTGHFGGSLAYGENYLDPLFGSDEAAPVEPAPAAPSTTPQTAPSATRADTPTPQAAAPQGSAPLESPLESPLEPPAEAASTYSARIAPLFAAYCTSCHGESKKKAALALHTPEAILEGSFGDPVIQPGDADASLLVQRVGLPLEHDDHMPPSHKPQPSAQDLALLAAWIDAGAPFEGTHALELGAPAAPSAAPAEAEPAAPPSGDRPAGEAPAGDPAAERSAQAPAQHADPSAIERARSEFVHVEALGADASALWVSFAAVATTTDEQTALRVLEPLAPFVAHLDLSRTQVGRETLELAAEMPHLSRLDLRATAVDDEALQALAGHPRLTSLVLARTAVTGASLATLETLPALRQVHLWGSGVSEDEAAEWSSDLPDLKLDLGTPNPPPILETAPLAGNG